MTKENRDRIIIESLGGCWHEWEHGETVENDWHCKKCWRNYSHGYGFDPMNQINTPNGFFWWWERAQKMEWWGEFWMFFAKKYFIEPKTTTELVSLLINSDRGADALAEFLEGRKK